MKINRLSGDYKSWIVSQTQLAKIVGVSQQRINQLADSQIVKRVEGAKNGELYLIESLNGYYSMKYSGGDLTKEKTLHERAKRELTELKLQQRRGEVYEAAVVENVLVECLTNFRNKLLGVPAKVSKQLEGKTVAQIYELLNTEIDEVLTELSEAIESIDLDEELQGVDEEAGGGDKTGTANDSKQMGE